MSRQILHINIDMQTLFTYIMTKQINANIHIYHRHPPAEISIEFRISFFVRTKTGRVFFFSFSGTFFPSSAAQNRALITRRRNIPINQHITPIVSHALGLGQFYILV